MGLTGARDRYALHRGDDMRLQCFWRPILPACAELICGDETAREVSIRMHETIRVTLPATSCVVVDGSGRCTIVHPGQIHIAAPFTLHGARSLNHLPCRIRSMLVPAAALARLAERRTSSSDTMALQQWLVEDAGLHAELSALCDELKAPLAADDCESRLAAALVKLLGDGIEQPSTWRTLSSQPGDTLTPFANYLLAHATENLSLDQLAAIAGFSKFYLLRSFRHAYGLTPHAYQMRLRLARAWRLIAEGAPLSWTAYDAGFADQSHLTRRFLALFGLTPGSLARQLTRSTPRDEAAAIARQERIASSAA